LRISKKDCSREKVAALKSKSKSLNVQHITQLLRDSSLKYIIVCANWVYETKHLEGDLDFQMGLSRRNLRLFEN